MRCHSCCQCCMTLSSVRCHNCCQCCMTLSSSSSMLQCKSCRHLYFNNFENFLNLITSSNDNNTSLYEVTLISDKHCFQRLHRPTDGQKTVNNVCFAQHSWTCHNSHVTDSNVAMEHYLTGRGKAVNRKVMDFAI